MLGNGFLTYKLSGGIIMFFRGFMALLKRVP
jgi:hypothetical protein